MSLGKKFWSGLLALSTILTFIGFGLTVNSQPSFAKTTNRGDVFLSAQNSTPPGHETDPHLGCPTYIYLWGSYLKSASGHFSIDGIAPSGSATGEPTSGGAYASDQAWPNDNAIAKSSNSIPPSGGASWTYNTTTGGDQVIARILTSQLIANALKNGDAYQSQQGFHFKVQFTQPLQKHKTFWVDCGDPTPAISVVKTANPTTYSSTGTTINYTYVVTNTGNVTLTGVTLTDNKLTIDDATACTLKSTDISTTPGILNPGDSETCKASYVTQSTDTSSITNTATATGTPPTGSNVKATSTAVVNYVAPVTSAPSIKVVKTANPTTYSSAGTTINYTYVVTNTGNVTLTNVTLADNKLPNLNDATACTLKSTDISTTPGTLNPGDIETCTASYVTKSTDTSSITNTATATGTPLTGSNVKATSTAVVNYVAPVTSAPSIKVVKTANPTTYSSTGTTINYTYVVTNTGNVTLTNVTLADNKLPNLNDATACTLNTGDKSTTLGTLDAGDIETCTASYSTTSADITNGSITNTATATGTPPTGSNVTGTSKAVVNYVAPVTSPSSPPPVTSPSSSPSVSPPGLTITKSSSPTSITAGSSSEYVINAAATGLVQAQVTVTDSLTAYDGVTYSLVGLPTPSGDTAWSSCSLLPSNVLTVSGVVQCTFTPPSGGISHVIFAPITVRVTTSTSTPSQVLANIASISYDSNSIQSNQATITVQRALGTPIVSPSSSASSSPPQPSSPSASHQPTTALSSSVVVPSTHTGEPWSSMIWWELMIGSGVAGLGLLLMSLRRRRYLS